jgi:hypothetical protein
MSPASKTMVRAMPTPRPAVAPGERAAKLVDGLGLEEAELELVDIIPVVETKDCDELLIVAIIVMVVVDVPTIAVIVDIPIMANL